MKKIQSKISSIDWSEVTASINENGFATIANFLEPEYCEELINGYDMEGLYRKTIQMERYRFGLGEYKYFRYTLPPIIQTIREEVYPKLVPVANEWMDKLNMKRKFPATLDKLLMLCRQNHQTEPTVLILKYGKGGHNTLHQDLYGDIFFPIQLVLYLNEPDRDYSGGEFVLTQQLPRAQSKAIVLKPRRGDMLLLTTNFRPVRGNKGYYKVNMKHGVSSVHEGQRHTVGIIFHDALN